MKIEDLDEQAGPLVPWVRLLGTLAVVGALWLGLRLNTKVNNELAMTDAYVRQAVALERMADSLQVAVQLKDKKDRVTVSYGANSFPYVRLPSVPTTVPNHKEVCTNDGCNTKCCVGSLCTTTAVACGPSYWPNTTK